MPVRDRYFKIRKIGSELYFSSRDKSGFNNWGPKPQAKLLNHKQILATIRRWKTFNEEDLDTIEFVEYDLLEQRRFSVELFYRKYSKTPLVSIS